ncbi:MAG: hypothetical protein M0R51_13160 [Clostridia bacterium]|jgi:hypothetical protein|nr:hypothetical protein [Clostridia bacterium]
MKTIMRYCRNCRGITPHDIRTNDFTGFGRVFFALISIGVSEIVREEYYVCQKCGRKVSAR